ncbi:hypothetical protein Leryth_008142 [Lithospermum erythrorhizon]|nr:hypothetical protein Leryth_008142 [Lithospermum erythrorhizon]
MAFHVSCPITCRKICYCTLGFPRLLRTEEGKDAFLEELGRIEEFLKDPYRRRANYGQTVQVKVPKVDVIDPPPPVLSVSVPLQLQQQKQLVSAEVVQVEDGGGGELDELALANASANTKRLALQKKGAATSVMVEDLARRLEAGDGVLCLQGKEIDFAGEELGQSNVKIMCRLCLSGENDGSERARKMLPCNSCGKKYHINCLKNWSLNRDLFHWSSWACPSCRICEVCCRTGDPNKFMYCKRCDAAHHCYCQQPPHKNVSSGPYLCPKHTKCHSCGSRVPGKGLSLRWFLGYTCCDACGRLFVKGNYCTVCLKVYRDSESTPMVCCDICQRWVHCQCDGISDEKYMEFQVDGNLEYSCPTCRGECSQIRSSEEAVLELWKKKDETDKDLIARLRAAAGLPTQEEIHPLSPFSDDEDNGPATSKNEYGRSIKLSLKNLVEKSPKKNEHGKKSSNKKSGKKKGGNEEYTAGDGSEELSLFPTREPDTFFFPAAESPNEKLKPVDEFVENNGVRTSRMVHVKSNSPDKGQFGNNVGSNISKSTKGPKLVIHLGSRNKNPTNSPRSDASSFYKEPELTTTSNGDKVDHTENINASKSKIRIRKSNPDTGKSMFGSVSTPSGHSLLGRGVDDRTKADVEAETEVPASRVSKLASLKYAEGHSKVSSVLDDVNKNKPAASNSVSKDSRPLLKLKFKKPHQENQVSWINPMDDEMSLPKGQRSKRKRPSSLQENASTQGVQGTAMDEIMDANWILQKLGKDAVGKRVEIHQASDNSWHRGTVEDVFEGTSVISVALDEGKARNLELGKQGVRFVSQK